MDEMKMVELINDINDKSIAKLGIMLADADANLRKAEKAFKLAINNKNAPLDQSVLGSLALAMNPQEITKQMDVIAKAREENARNAELLMMDANAQYRRCAIMFDTARLIIDNRNKAK